MPASSSPCTFCGAPDAAVDDAGRFLIGQYGSRSHDGTVFAWRAAPHERPAVDSLCDACVDALVAHDMLEPISSALGPLPGTLSQHACVTLFLHGAADVLDKTGAGPSGGAPASTDRIGALRALLINAAPPFFADAETRNAETARAQAAGRAHAAAARALGASLDAATLVTAAHRWAAQQAADRAQKHALKDEIDRVLQELDPVTTDTP